MVHKVFPDLALVDGKYLDSAPQSLIVNTSVDALAHLYESVLNAKVNDYVRMTAYAGLKCWAKTKDVLNGKRKRSTEDNALLMRSSLFAGMSIAQSGTSLPHALSYALTYDLKLPHGKVVGYFLPGFLAAAPAEQRDELLKLSGFEDQKEFDSFIFGLFDDINVQETELQRAGELVSANRAKMESASFYVDDKVLESILKYR
jgi:alcohol dehydrogenase